MKSAGDGFNISLPPRIRGVLRQESFDQSPGDGAMIRYPESEDLLRIEPARLSNLLFLENEISAGERSGKGDHQGVRERPRLASKVAEILHFDSDLFPDFPVHALLERLPRLDESGQYAVKGRREPAGSCKEDL